LRSSCALVEAKSLAVLVVTFFFQLNVRKFAERFVSSRRSKPIVSEACAKPKTNDTESLESVAMYGFTLNLDLWGLVKAATDVGLHCTALLFAEMACQKTFSVSVRESLNANMVCVNIPIDEGEEMTSQAFPKCTFFYSFCVVAGTTTVKDILLDILKGLHDPDAVFGLSASDSVPLEVAEFVPWKALTVVCRLYSRKDNPIGLEPFRHLIPWPKTLVSHPRFPSEALCALSEASGCSIWLLCVSLA
jgi:hypothetical protein